MLPYSEALCPPPFTAAPFECNIDGKHGVELVHVQLEERNDARVVAREQADHGCHPVPRCITLCHTIPWHTKPYLYICCRRGSRWWEWSHAPPFTITPPPMPDPVPCFGQRKPKNWRKIKPQCLNEICAIIFLTRNPLWTHLIVGQLTVQTVKIKHVFLF